MTKCGSIICFLCFNRIFKQGIGSETRINVPQENLSCMNMTAEQLPPDNINQAVNNKPIEPENLFAENQKTKQPETERGEKRYLLFDNPPDKQFCKNEAFCENEGLCGGNGRGLLYYKKWWENTIVDIFIAGDCITGTPIFINENTLRVVNESFSYFIPLEKIDYIRTSDGLKFEK